MRAIAIPLLACLLAACGESRADDASRLVTPEFADASAVGSGNPASADQPVGQMMTVSAAGEDAALNSGAALSFAGLHAIGFLRPK